MEVLDLYPTGESSLGYHLAGFDVTGVGPTYPHRYLPRFHETDPLHLVERFTASGDVARYALVHVELGGIGSREVERLPRLLDLLAACGRPYVVHSREVECNGGRQAALCSELPGDPCRHRVYRLYGWPASQDAATLQCIPGTGERGSMAVHFTRWLGLQFARAMALPSAA